MQRTPSFREPGRLRHTVLVRITHCLTTLSFFVLLVTGVEIVISHPRFYWGESGNVNMQPLFTLHIPSSRSTVPTGYGLMPDQNGWSRYLHFEMAWVLVLTGLVYVAASLWNGHLRRDLVPPRGERGWRAMLSVLRTYLRREPAASEDAGYNSVQRVAYLAVIFVLFPLIVLTGLAMSPAFDSAFPAAVGLLGGRQSARTLHFLLTWAIVLFVMVHVAMVVHAGFWSKVRAMITGRAHTEPELPTELPDVVRLENLEEQP